MIYVYTDGSIKGGNPGGHTGAGALVTYVKTPGSEPMLGRPLMSLSIYLGQGTNNTAELAAILIGLRAIRRTREPVVVVSDSQYAIGVLARGHKPRAHVELIHSTIDEIERLNHVEFVWCKGHDGLRGNEWADALAKEASATRASRVIRYRRTGKTELPNPGAMVPHACRDIHRDYA